MKTLPMRQMIIRSLEEKIGEVYVEMQDRYDIKDGSISPPDSFDQDEKTSELAEVIERMIRKQKGEIYMTSQTRERDIKVETNYTLKMTRKDWEEINIARGIIFELEHLFDGIDTRYMNVLGDAENILLDIVNEEGKFKVEIIDE